MATIAYRGRAGDSQREVDELRFNDRTGHWKFPVDESDDGDTVYRSIPRERVYYVEQTRESAGSRANETPPR